MKCSDFVMEKYGTTVVLLFSIKKGIYLYKTFENAADIFEIRDSFNIAVLNPTSHPPASRPVNNMNEAKNITELCILFSHICGTIKYKERTKNII